MLEALRQCVPTSELRDNLDCSSTNHAATGSHRIIARASRAAKGKIALPARSHTAQPGALTLVRLLFAQIGPRRRLWLDRAAKPADDRMFSRIFGKNVEPCSRFSFQLAMDWSSGVAASARGLGRADALGKRAIEDVA